MKLEKQITLITVENSDCKEFIQILNLHAVFISANADRFAIDKPIIKNTLGVFECYKGKEEIYLFHCPEQHAHPFKQIAFVREVVEMANENPNFKAIICTHSDWIAKELNNCLMLENCFKDKPPFTLERENFTAYIVLQTGELKPVTLDEYGMTETGFDYAISDMNERTEFLGNIIAAKTNNYATTQTK